MSTRRASHKSVPTSGPAAAAPTSGGGGSGGGRADTSSRFPDVPAPVPSDIAPLRWGRGRARQLPVPGPQATAATTRISAATPSAPSEPSAPVVHFMRQFDGDEDAAISAWLALSSAERLPYISAHEKEVIEGTARRRPLSPSTIAGQLANAAETQLMAQQTKSHRELEAWTIRRAIAEQRATQITEVARALRDRALDRLMHAGEQGAQAGDALFFTRRRYLRARTAVTTAWLSEIFTPMNPTPESASGQASFTAATLDGLNEEELLALVQSELQATEQVLCAPPSPAPVHPHDRADACLLYCAPQEAAAKRQASSALRAVSLGDHGTETSAKRLCANASSQHRATLVPGGLPALATAGAPLPTLVLHAL